MRYTLYKYIKMSILQKEAGFNPLVTLLAFLPVALFAYLGQFSRIIKDDYIHFAVGRELGPWQSVLYWRDIHNGSYTHYFLHGLLAPLDTLIPPITPTVIIVLWLLGLAWLISQALSALQVRQGRLLIAITLAAVIVTAAINAMYSLEAFYWYSASTRYTLPLAVFTIYLALVVKAARSVQALGARVAVALVGATLCFIIAGLAEMYLVFQLAFLISLIIFFFVFADKSARFSYIVLLGAGLAGTCASLFLQLTAPGVALRSIKIAQSDLAQSMRSLPALFSETANRTFQYIGHQEAFAGFVLLLAGGLFLTLRLYKAPLSPPRFQATISRKPLWLGLIVQLCFMPILWTHTSDNLQVFGRFSFAFATVISLNLALTLAFVFLLWQPYRLRNRKRWLVYSSLMLALFLLFFTLTQLKSIHYKAATYLFLSALSFLGLLCWQLILLIADERFRRYGVYALIWQLLTAAIFVALLVVSLYVHGTVFGRILVVSTFMQVLSGLFWGCLLGLLMKQVCLPPSAGKLWLAWRSKICLAVLLIICVGVSYGQVWLIPDFATFAKEWDERHQLMLRLRDDGYKEIEVAPLTFDLAEYLWRSGLSAAYPDSTYWYTKRYFGFESITEITEAD